jgi:hypothetical protein
MPRFPKSFLDGKIGSPSTIVTSPQPRPTFMKKGSFQQAPALLKQREAESLRFTPIHQNPYGWMMEASQTFV